MSRIGRIQGALTLLVALAACEQRPALPEDHGRRQQELSERVLARVQRAGGGDDAALALAEVAVPGHAPRLRLVAAGEDPVLARGAARALVKILQLREDDDPGALRRCFETESNDAVREECAAVLAVMDGGAKVTGPAPTKAMLGGGVEERREALRRALRVSEETLAKVPGLDSALVHLLEDEDEVVRLLVSAVWLRRSLRVAPPPIDPAVR